MEEKVREPLPSWITALGVAAAIAIVTLVQLFGLPHGSARIAAPAAYKPFETPDKSVQGIGPDGWKRTRSLGMGGLGGTVKFVKGDAHIVVTNDLAGSLMGDIAAAQNAQMSNGNEVGSSGMPAGLGGLGAGGAGRPPVEQLHLIGKKAMEERFQDYEESDKMQPVRCEMGEGRFSEFTAKLREGVLGKGETCTGWRVTILGSEKEVQVRCWCPTKDWKSLKPAFEKVVLSLKPGKG